MKTILLKAGEEEFFKTFIPALMLENLNLPNMQAIGAAVTEDGEDIPVGIIIFSNLPEDSFVIEWIYIDENHRGVGIGSELIKLVYELAKENGAKKLAARFIDDMPCEGDMSDLMGFFESFGLYHMDNVNDEWIFDAESMKEESFFKKALESMTAIGEVQPIFDLSSEEMIKAVSQMSETGKVIELFSPYGRDGFFDPEFSFKMEKDGAIKGLFLVHRQGHTLIPVCFGIADSEYLIDFLNGIAAITSARLKSSEKIRIISRTNEAHFLTKALIKDIGPVKGEYRFCDISDIEDISERESETTEPVYKSFYIEDYPTEEYEFIEDLYYTREW